MPEADRVFISLLGPPNSGKSTLTGTLCACLDAHLIRPRDAIRRTITMQPYATDLFAPIDELGWVADYALAYAVRTMIDALPPATRKVVLENLPWDALQLMDLQDLVSRTSAELVLLFVDAPDDVLIKRSFRRRVCQTCELDPMSEPRRPALPAVNDAERCGACGSPLAVRPDDRPAILTRRVQRSRRYLAQIMRIADDAHIPIHRLDGTQPVDEVVHAAFAILSKFCDLGLQGSSDLGKNRSE